MNDYGYITWKKCPFCDTELEERELLAHSVNDCDALENGPNDETPGGQG